MEKRRWPMLLLIASLAIALPVCKAHAGTTLERVRAAGSLTCGIDTEEPEYTLDDAHGNRGTFDMDLCKAVAAAVLGENAKIVIKPFRDEADSLKALAAGEIDLLATASVNLRTGNGSYGFARPIFYDHQGLLVNKTAGIHSIADLKGKKICFLIGTEIERQLTAYMLREQISFVPGPFSEEGEMEAAFVTRNCAAVSADVSQLAYERIAFRNMAQNFEILPEVIAKDPLAPAVRLGDPQWAAIVDWTMQALIQAEESGVTQANVKAMKASGDMVLQRLLGTQRGYGQFLSLDDDWAARTIEAVGNYGEIFERDLGSGSPMKLERGMNKLWTQGGLMYANPMR
ncbi:MAG: transporter substrate-binding domain-containing protein [Terracidiphilus sp.]|jgi:general L-amino acid transport system substrate-binding protein